MARYPERKLGVGLLGAGFDNFIHRGGQAEDPLSQEDYGNILRASKITVNFSRPVFDEEGFQCKGRVIEALSCGTLLLEQKNPETERWLIPGRDYADFADEREMIDKAKYYLAHEEERASIADAGHQKVRRLYSGAAYWRLILDALQVKPGGAS